MKRSSSTNELSPGDRLITRPDEPLPVHPDPREAREHPTDPKPEPPQQGQGTDPRAGDLDHVA